MTKLGAGDTAQQGFTLIELVVTMIVLGIIAVVALPRLFERRDYDARAFFDQTAAALRYAQKAAIAQRRTVCVNFTANAVTLTIKSTAGAGACDTPLAAPFTVMAPGTVTFNPTPAGFSFDAGGRPSAGATITIDGIATALTVEAETGYVHD